MFARRGDDETVVTKSARVRGIPALMSSTRGRKRMGLAYRDFNATINIKGCVVLKTRPQELRRVI